MTRIAPSAGVALAVLGLATAPAAAAPIVGGRDTYTVVNFQSVELYPGTPFNPGSVSLPPVVVRADGTLVVDRNTQVGSTITGGTTLADLTGTFPAPLPPIPFRILAGTGAGLPPVASVISNVVQNPADPGFAAGLPSSLVSGDFREEATFVQILPDGTTLYSDPANPAVFTAAVTGLPHPVGTIFVSPEPVNLYLQLGPGFDTTRDLLIGRSFDRSIIITGVVPEPATLGLLVAVSGMAAVRRRRGRPACRASTVL